MPLDKKNFQGGLNRDDDSRVAPNGDYHYAQNVRVLSSEGRNAMLVENIRGTKQIVYNHRIKIAFKNNIFFYFHFLIIF